MGQRVIWLDYCLIKFINVLESCKKNLQFKILESLFAEIKKNLTGSYENYHFELKYDSMVMKPKNKN